MSLRLHPLSGTNLHLSTFCCGVGGLFALPQDQSDALLDAFVEAGGNFFDTAHVYSSWLPRGHGLSEMGIGDYVHRRGLKNVTVATKGGHPTFPRYRKVDQYLSPGRIGADIDDSLARLEYDTITLYYLHRDDTRVPVGEIMEYLNSEINRGRIRYPAASNWSVKRLAEAKAYADAKKLQPFVLSEPQWSLATFRLDKTAADVVAAMMNETSVAWYRENRFPAAPYSPTAHGFFDGNTEEGYDTPENHQRRERATELAKKYSVTPGQIALAWLTHQSFPVFPILGTSNPKRLKEALAADKLCLTEQEVAWLHNG